MSEWQPIETAPRDGTEIIARMGTATPPYCESMYFVPFDDDESDGMWHWTQDGDAPAINKPTHWMPLPSPPARALEGEG